LDFVRAIAREKHERGMRLVARYRLRRYGSTVRLRIAEQLENGVLCRDGRLCHLATEIAAAAARRKPQGQALSKLVQFAGCAKHRAITPLPFSKTPNCGDSPVTEPACHDSHNDRYSSEWPRPLDPSVVLCSLREWRRGCLARERICRTCTRSIADQGPGGISKKIQCRRTASRCSRLIAS